MTDLIAPYSDSTGPFAADTFDALEPRCHDRITVTDLLAATFLDMYPTPRAALSHLGSNAPELERQLRQLGPDLPLWEAADESLTAACELFDRLDAYDDVGPVITGKLLARKRPSAHSDRGQRGERRAVPPCRLPPDDAAGRVAGHGPTSSHRQPAAGPHPPHDNDAAAACRGRGCGPAGNRNAKAARAGLGVPEPAEVGA